MATCLMCNGTGRTKSNPFKCAKCGVEFRKESILSDVDNSNVYIPAKYRDELWEKSKAIEGNRNEYSNIQQRDKANKWVEVLSNILKSVEKSRPMPGTIYVSAPSDSSKTRWAYTLQLTAHSKGYKITQIVDALDINMDLSLDDVLMSDILILRITNYKLNDVLGKLNYLIPKRSERDLMTIIITSLPFEYVNTQKDYLTFDVDYLVQRFS